MCYCGGWIRLQTTGDRGGKQQCIEHCVTNERGTETADMRWMTGWTDLNNLISLPSPLHLSPSLSLVKVKGSKDTKALTSFQWCNHINAFWCVIETCWGFKSSDVESLTGNTPKSSNAQISLLFHIDRAQALLIHAILPPLKQIPVSASFPSHGKKNYTQLKMLLCHKRLTPSVWWRNESICAYMEFFVSL